MKSVYKIIYFTILFFSPYILYSQIIQGKVYEKTANGKSYLPGVNVIIKGTTKGVSTNTNGLFELKATLPTSLIFSYVGFQSDTLFVKDSKYFELELKSSIELKAITIEAREQTTKISSISSINIETITTKELQKAACCNLSESFETNASVDVSFKDGVSGTKQIQMLGLDGAYTQLLAEGMPAIRGLSSGFGLNLIPGTWVESIQITKGSGSVVNGYESITGQINIELQKPETSERFFFNGYANHAGRYEGNLHLSHKLNEKWSTLLLSHGSFLNRKNDFNKDGFIDMPIMSQLNAINRWKYKATNKFMAQFGVKALIDERIAGQLTFENEKDHLTKKAYGIGIDTKQFEFFSKTAFGFKQPYNSLGLMTNLKRYEHSSFYGLKKYNGDQNSAYFNLIYQTIIGSTDHQLKGGASYVIDQYLENYNDSAFERKELVPGIFTEYTYEVERKYSLVAGLRADFHNLYGSFLSPRLHIKYHPIESATIRLSAGKGLRVANAFIDNASILASSRKILITEKLNPEIAWNYGFNYTHKFNLFNREAVFNSDYFYTDFENQVIADFDAGTNLVKIYNLNGVSYSHSVQAEFTFDPIKNLSFKTAYKWYDVQRTIGNELLPVPFQSKNRVLLNIGYITQFDKWKFDFTTKWFGESRIPNVNDINNNSNSTFSDPYLIFNSQITRSFKHFDIYLGGENLSNFMQEDAIIAANDPFGENFDASLIWGPVMGRVIYGGFRFTIK